VPRLLGFFLPMTTAVFKTLCFALLITTCIYSATAQNDEVDYEDEWESEFDDQFDEDTAIGFDDDPTVGGLDEKDDTSSQSSKSTNINDVYEDDEFEDDEIESEVKSTNKPKKQYKPKNIDIDEVEVKQGPKNYFMEISFCAAFVVYFAVYFYGSHQNYKIAATWSSTFTKLFESQFTRVGTGATSIERLSAYTYELIATGRMRCIGLHATLTLQRRHDLISLLYYIISPGYDSLTIDVAMNHLDDFSFVVINQKKKKDFVEERPSLKYTRQVASLGNLSVLASHKEVSQLLLKPEFSRILKDHIKNVELIYFTNKTPEQKEYKKTLRFVFRVPDTTDEQVMSEKLSALIKLALTYIDVVATKKLSSQARKQINNARQKRDKKKTHEELHELAQKRKEEKWKREEEEFAKLPPEVQRKREIQMQKRELKRKKKSMSKVKMVMK